MASPRTVAVLGAGFTRAFVPSAPLLIDDYGVSQLLDAFKAFPHAVRVLQSSLKPDGRVNIEDLLTRLDGVLPYDFERGAAPELSLLLTAITEQFRRRIEATRESERDEARLAKFAKYCVDRNVTCVTFNYDDILDEALWKYKRIISTTEDKQYWHPDGGYGFFCKPSRTLVRTADVGMDTTCMYLLKLHGSMNWRIIRGSGRPVAIDGLVHHEEWLPDEDHDEGDEDDDEDEETLTPGMRAAIANHLEREPFIIPPVLVKSSLAHEPILRLIWSRAFEALEQADEVIFLGYSMPTTDIATQFLFREAVNDSANLRVVNYAPTGEVSSELVDSYRKVFPTSSRFTLDFSGIASWVDELSPANT
jgi:hypothetical protein